MINKASIHTDNAPAAIGTYSQAVKVNNTTYLSGQIPLIPATMAMVDGGFEQQIEQVLQNLAAVCKAADGTLKDIVKLNIFLTNMSNFPLVNDAMERHFSAPYPARAVIGVNELPKGALVEMDAIMVV
jgi:reactive intermediate/imine deaminase